MLLLLQPPLTVLFGQLLLLLLQCPVLLIWSKHNPGNSPEHAQKALRYLRDGNMIVLDDCGHWPQWEQPVAYNQAQLDFLLS